VYYFGRDSLPSIVWLCKEMATVATRLLIQEFILYKLKIV